ncbi:MAG TPA: hypothetical protein VKS82_24990 [Streptosporangiaceae bacterium]|nr:hypothetical protein [Streptosporangiaceae bacterium]
MTGWPGSRDAGSRMGAGPGRRRPRGHGLTRAAGLLVAVAAAALGAGVAGSPARAAPEPAGDCTTTSGVIVAVDFAPWGGPVLRSCGTTPTTAYTLLNQGGWHTTGTEHDGPGFICRIGYAGYHGGTQYPTAAQESCVLTPPASAYWAFWYANRGQNTWSYSQAGAMGIRPEPGSVELWVFGGTNTGGTSGSAVPAISPANLRATNTSPLPTVRGPSSRKSPPAPARQTTSATQPAAPSGTTRAGGGAAATPSPPPAVRNAQPTVASAPVSHGSALPAILALVIVTVLVVTGIVAAARRPRRVQ